VPYRTAQGIEYRLQRGGDQEPWDTREVKHRNFVFRIPMTGLADAPSYLRVQSESVVTVPAYLWRPEAMIATDRNTQFG
jgi:7TMR-DISM extracellular 2